MQQAAALHAVFGMPRDELAFQLEQKDGDGLKRRRFSHGAGVGLAGEQGQRPQADAVAGFQQLHVVVLQAAAHDGGHAHGVAGGRAHPQDIMVAPFDVHGMVVQKQIHDAVRVRASIIDIAHDVQPVHRQALDQPAQRHDELISAADVDQRVDDLLMVNELVVVLVRQGVEQLVQNVGVGRGRRLAHLGARVLGGEHAA